MSSGQLLFNLFRHPALTLPSAHSIEILLRSLYLSYFHLLSVSNLAPGFGPSDVCQIGGEIGGVSTSGAYILLTENFSLAIFYIMYSEVF